MGRANLTEAIIREIIRSSKYNEIVRALKQNFNPRNAQGVATNLSGSLGEDDLKWANAFLEKLSVAGFSLERKLVGDLSELILKDSTGVEILNLSTIDGRVAGGGGGSDTADLRKSYKYNMSVIYNASGSSGELDSTSVTPLESLVDPFSAEAFTSFNQYSSSGVAPHGDRGYLFEGTPGQKLHIGLSEVASNPRLLSRRSGNTSGQSFYVNLQNSLNLPVFGAGIASHTDVGLSKGYYRIRSQATLVSDGEPINSAIILWHELNRNGRSDGDPLQGSRVYGAMRQYVYGDSGTAGLVRTHYVTSITPVFHPVITGEDDNTPSHITLSLNYDFNMPFNSPNIFRLAPYIGLSSHQDTDDSVTLIDYEMEILKLGDSI